MSNDKYTLFKNYMHNELGITKDDIKRWTKEAVTNVAEIHVKNHLNNAYLRDRIIKHVVQSGYNGFSDDIKKAISNAIVDKLNITFNE